MSCLWQVFIVNVGLIFEKGVPGAQISYLSSTLNTDSENI